MGNTKDDIQENQLTVASQSVCLLRLHLKRLVCSCGTTFAVVCLACVVPYIGLALTGYYIPWGELHT